MPRLSAGRIARVFAAGISVAGCTASILLALPETSAAAAITTFGAAQCTTNDGYCTGVAANAAGDSYAIAYSGHGVFEFDPNGNVINSWGQFGSAAGQLEYPNGIALDSSGNVWVTDVDQTQEFSPIGASMQTFGPGSGGQDLSIDSAGDVYVEGQQTIREYSSTGGLLTTLTMGSNGLPSAGELVKIATDPSGTEGFYTLDSQGDQLFQFSPTGQYVQTIGGEGGGNGQFEDPSGLAVDGNGDVYVADDPGGSDFRIQKFSPTGSFLASLNYASPEIMGLSITGNELYVAHFWAGIDRVDLTTPFAEISPIGSLQSTGKAITLSAANSAFPFGSISDYQWDLTGSGNFSTDTGTSPTTTVTYSTPGSKTVSLEVTAANGTTATTSLTFNVGNPTPPSTGPPTTSSTGAPIGVSINDGDYATDSPRVTLDLSPPIGTTSMLVSNDGGFGSAAGTQAFPASAKVSWTLRGQKNTRTLTIVYVQFSGPYGTTATYTDGIVLDETMPTLTSATLVPSSGAVTSKLRSTHVALAKHRYELRIVAKEKVSGVSAVQTSSRPSGGSIMTLDTTTHRGVLKLDKVLAISDRTAPRYARVRSAAGKWSRWLAVAGAK